MTIRSTCAERVLMILVYHHANQNYVSNFLRACCIVQLWSHACLKILTSDELWEYGSVEQSVGRKQIRIYRVFRESVGHLYWPNNYAAWKTDFIPFWFCHTNIHHNIFFLIFVQTMLMMTTWCHPALTVNQREIGLRQAKARMRMIQYDYCYKSILFNECFLTNSSRL